MVDDSDRIVQLDQKAKVLETTQTQNVAKITDVDNRRKALNALGARVIAIDSAISNINLTITNLNAAITEIAKDALVNPNIISALNHVKTLAEQQVIISTNVKQAINTIAADFAGNGG